jgi:CYTH domain-containing protein
MVGNLEGLVLAEFSSRDKSEEFEPPDWLGEEVTEPDLPIGPLTNENEH